MNTGVARQVLFLMPSTPGERLLEDGLLNCMEAKGIDYDVVSYRKMPCAKAVKECDRFLNNPAVYCVVYPHFDCEVWRWEGASQDWFFGWAAGRPVLEPRKGEDLVGGAGFLRMIEARGVKLVPMPFHYAGPFVFEISFYGKPEDFVEELLKQVPDLPHSLAEPD